MEKAKQLFAQCEWWMITGDGTQRVCKLCSDYHNACHKDLVNND